MVVQRRQQPSLATNDVRLERGEREKEVNFSVTVGLCLARRLDSSTSTFEGEICLLSPRERTVISIL